VINLELQKPDYVEALQLLSTELKGKLSGNCLTIPPAKGKGYIWAERLPWGMTVMVSVTSMSEELVFSTNVASEYSFCLQFNDAHIDGSTPARPDHRNKHIAHVQTSVSVTDTLNPIKTVLPAGITLRSVKLFFKQ
jgi:hypothetical protein